MAKSQNSLLSCACCKHRTLGERGDFEIFPVCFWEDDGNDILSVPSGPHGNITLTQAQLSYKNFAAYCHQDMLYVLLPFSK